VETLQCLCVISHSMPVLSSRFRRLRLHAESQGRVELCLGKEIQIPLGLQRMISCGRQE
jgi:hypothetical protein